MKFTKTLQYGSFGTEVYRLQILLEQLGFADFFPLGVFGGRTSDAVVEFQRAYNISPAIDMYGNAYGLVGPKTRAKLNELADNLNSILIYGTALRYLDTDPTPEDNIPDDVGCAEAVEKIVEEATGEYLNCSGSTYKLKAILDSSSNWVKIDKPETGAIILSATGYGNGNLKHGHTGIVEVVGDVVNIISNSSKDGLLKRSYTLDTWNARYRDIGGFPVDFYKKIK